MSQKGKPGYSLITIFKRAFRILMIDDEVQVCSLANSIFEHFPLLHLDTVHTARQAEERLSNHLYHLIFCDLGLNDLSGDQYYLVKKYGAVKPLIILSGHASMSESAVCMSAGALWVYDKPRVFDRAFFSQVLDRFLLRSLFLHAPGGFPHKRYSEAIDALIAQRPDTVEMWARILDVNERYLRKICAHSPLPLFHLIHTFHLVTLAFCCGLSNPSCPPCAAADRKTRSDCQKLIEFYYLNKSAIDRFLRIRADESSASA